MRTFTVESEFVFFQFLSRFFDLSELLGALPFFVSAKRDGRAIVHTLDRAVFI